ncbi:MAG: hypothetical protein ACFFB5_09070 [Promethearchaeota archaeon]
MPNLKKAGILILISFLIIFMLTKTSMVTSETKPLDTKWTSDGSSLIGWSQCHGDPTYESESEYIWDVESYEDDFTPENKSLSTQFWDPNYDTDEVYRCAGIFRLELGLNESTWILELTVSFDVTNTNTFSFLGDIGIIIDNANKEPMLLAKIRDHSAVGSSHSVIGETGYYLTDSSYSQVIYTTANSTDRDIDSGTFAMKKNSSGIFIYFPEEIPDGSGWRLLADNTAALQRGTPTYIRLYFSRRRLGPADARIENVTFKQGASWVSDGSSLTTWSQCHGDTAYETENSYIWDVESYNNDFTPENKTLSTQFWDPNYDTDEIYRYAGIFREEPGLIESNWILELTVSFDVTNTNTFSFLGDIGIIIDNANKEPMLLAKIRDHSAVGSSHSVIGETGYYLTDSSYSQVIYTTANSTDRDIDSGTFAMKKNSSGIFIYFPEEIPDGSGWRLLADNTAALQRGTPTYIRLYFSRRRLGPADARIEDVRFKYGIPLQLSTTIPITSSSTTEATSSTETTTSSSTTKTTSSTETTTSSSTTKTTSSTETTTSSSTTKTTSSTETTTSTSTMEPTVQISPSWTYFILCLSILVILLTRRRR